MTQTLNQTLPQFTYVDWCASTASTNKDLLEMARSATLARPWLQGTHLQKQGRGRAGRVWQNQSGACLMFSCAFDVRLAAPQLPMLSPLSGTAACQALRACMDPAYRQGLNLKWPNDLQWRGAKLAGILVETMHADISRQQHTVIMGIGINLRNARALGQALGRDVADWSQIMQIDTQAAACDAAHIVTNIAQYWHASILHLHTQGGGDFVQQYAQVDALAGIPVNILDRGAIMLSGVANGINKDGQLIVRTNEDDVAITVGEVSVRTS